MNGGEALAEVLKREGVEQIFCFPSSSLIDAAAAAGIRPIVGREERSVINMADAYSRVTNGRSIGVVMVQGGPGIEHSFGSIAQAYADSVPLLMLPGGVARGRYGVRNSFDAVEAYRPITKWASRFTTAASVPEQLRRAFVHLRSGRPGPVVLEMPADVVAEQFDGFAYHSPERPRSAADPAKVTEAVRLLLSAERPVFYAGQGVLWAEATDELVELAELVQVPVMTSYIGKSAFPENHPLALGAGGAALSAGIYHLLPKADLVFGIGSSLLRSLGAHGIPAGRTIVQATADPDDLGAEYPIACGLVGDAKLVLTQLIEEVRSQLPGGRPTATGLHAEIAEARSAGRREIGDRLSPEAKPINPYRVIDEIMRAVDPATTIITHDSGYPRDHLAPTYESVVPRGYLGWGQTTPLGSSLGLALGAKAAAPDKTVIAFMGDAAFGQSGLEVETSVRNHLPILVVLVNNGEMGVYEKMQPVAVERYGLKYLSGKYGDVAAALGAHTERVENAWDLAPALAKALEQVAGGQTAVLEVITTPEPFVFRL
ncbi:MAG: thiamine pyrophosphate-requiring protein [Acidimicrobiaceae bacterium]|nr:thiamine pyrophosphate-requiring protein [Acidimicrobiaceae bacterium]